MSLYSYEEICRECRHVVTHHCEKCTDGSKFCHCMKCFEGIVDFAEGKCVMKEILERKGE